MQIWALWIMAVKSIVPFYPVGRAPVARPDFGFDLAILRYQVGSFFDSPCPTLLITDNE